MRSKEELILYRNFDEDEEGELFEDMCEIFEEYSEDDELDEDDALEFRDTFFECLGSLTELAAKYGFSGNLWHNYMTYLIVNHENAYSKACEINGEPDGSLSKIAAHDFAILKSLFDFPLGEIGDLFEADVLLSIGNYKASQREGSAYNTVIRDKIQELSKELARAKSAVAFQKAVSSFYAQYGVGKLGLHKAFRIERIENEYENEVLIKPINNVLPVSLDDLVGYEDAKR